MNSFIFFDTAHVIKTHDYVIQVSGGNLGINNLNLLESVIEHIRNDLYYPEFEDKITHLVFSV